LRRWTPALVTGAAGVALAAVHGLVAWHGDGMETARHLVVPALQLRVGVLLLAVGLLPAPPGGAGGGGVPPGPPGGERAGQGSGCGAGPSASCTRPRAGRGRGGSGRDRRGGSRPVRGRGSRGRGSGGRARRRRPRPGRSGTTTPARPGTGWRRPPRRGRRCGAA